MERLFTYIVIGLLVGCTSYKETCRKGLPEKQYDFLVDIKRQSNFNYLEAIVDFRQFGAYSKNLWVRKSESLKIVYSSLKQIGLKRFISEEEFNKPLFTDHWAETSWANKSINQIVQNLIQSYSDTTGFDKYYIEFWNRRKADKNESVVLQILTDIMSTYDSDTNPEKLHWKLEPTLTRLLYFEVKLKESDSLTLKKTNIDYHKYLKSIGLYSSANNLIRYENELLFGESESQDTDYVELINQIETDSVNCEEYWNWRQSAEWFTAIYDYGP
ncbi:hypothetical protein JKA74_06845 [Marivirga sp. S37H4]|uniref:Lipoprotein n=1 Tax=Marivirga aurantiaca TaxID=2802615 RepID=A0A934WX63_9BACT|nr:hypothetical protein [Marivirga aurantiaca]MBK6264749.1 hypothetical protein [Marivirga aurantiaca]